MSNPRLFQRPGEVKSLQFLGARLFDPRAGLDQISDLTVEAGAVSSIGDAGTTEPLEGAEVIDCAGLLLMPAFVDPHVHFRTPGQENKEDLVTGTRAAAAGGYSAVIAMANTEPPVDSASVLGSVIERAERECCIPTGFGGCVTKGMRGEELAEMAEMREVGAIGFSDDGLPIADGGVLRRALQYQRLVGGTFALLEETPDLSGSGVMNEGAVSALLGMEGIPSISESAIISRDCEIALYEDARVQIQHLSARASVEAIRRAKEAGTEVTCEVTPHHLLLTDEEVRGLDAHFKMNPPLRTEDDRQSLVEGLRDGTIDCVATDHAPHAAEDKEVPFEQAAMGVTGLETAFPALYSELVLPGTLELERLIEVMTCGGEAFGIDAPTMEKGSEANLVLVDPAEEWTVGEDGYESRSANSCFAGRRLTGRVLMTVAAGQVAYRHRAFAMAVAE
ncbi:MAG: dihydroorotase [Solirubrobacterales bacterium]